MRSHYQLTRGRRLYAASVVSVATLFAIVHGLAPSGDALTTAAGARNARVEMTASAEAQLRAAERICRGTLSAAKCGHLAAPQATL